MSICIDDGLDMFVCSFKTDSNAREKGNESEFPAKKQKDSDSTHLKCTRKKTRTNFFIRSKCGQNQIQ